MKNDFEIRGDYVVIFMPHKDGNVYETKIDLEDLEKVQSVSFKWCAQFQRDRHYVCGYSRETGSIRLHRFVMKCSSGHHVDHVNGDTLDNRKCNLRILTNAQNIQHRVKLNKNNTSGIRGVGWSKWAKKWWARIKVNRKLIHVGYFDNLSDAEIAVSLARAEYMPYSTDAMERQEEAQ